ncbi:MAG: hypothetical protein K8H90_06315 [Thermoanaerobaculia bacterium]|nr:hypothetical protein [Thermoanaerobaculia bacterium]
MPFRIVLSRATLLALALAGLAASAPAFGQPPICEFQSHQVVPARPAPGQPFTVTVAVFADCVAFHPPVVAADRVTVDVEYGCAIDPSPPPAVWEHSFDVPGLPAGTWAVEFRSYFPPEQLLYRFALTIGTALDVPALGGFGALLLAGLLLGSALSRLQRKRSSSADRLG